MLSYFVHMILYKASFKSVLIKPSFPGDSQAGQLTPGQIYS